MISQLHESAVRGEPGGTTVPARILTEQDGHALVLIEGDGLQLRAGDVVTVDTASLSLEDCPACADRFGNDRGPTT